MKVKTVERFTDLKEDKVREVNDEFEVTQARYEEVKRFVKVVEEPKKKKGD